MSIRLGGGGCGCCRRDDRQFSRYASLLHFTSTFPSLFPFGKCFQERDSIIFHRCTCQTTVLEDSLDLNSASTVVFLRDERYPTSCLSLVYLSSGSSCCSCSCPSRFSIFFDLFPILPADAGVIEPLAGFGVGLPLSRVYAKYFGGDIMLKSMEGFGMDR